MPAECVQLVEFRAPKRVQRPFLQRADPMAGDAERLFEATNANRDGIRRHATRIGGAPTWRGHSSQRPSLRRAGDAQSAAHRRPCEHAIQLSGGALSRRFAEMLATWFSGRHALATRTRAASLIASAKSRAAPTMAAAVQTSHPSGGTH